MLSSSNQFGQIILSYQRAGEIEKGRERERERERERIQLTTFTGYELVILRLFPQLHSLLLHKQAIASQA